MNLYIKLLTVGVAILTLTMACSSSQSDTELSNKVASPNQAEEIVQVPEDYVVQVVAGPELVDYPMFSTIGNSGCLFVFESTGNVYEKSKDAINNPQFRIKLLEDEDGDGVYDKSTIFADSVGFPQGGVFYKGSLYASSAPDLLKFTDTDGDGVADKREVILSGWTLNINANSLVGPAMGPDGWLYMTSAIMGFNVTTKEGERLKGETSRIWRVRPDGSDLEWVSAGGMNNPVELTFTEAGEPIGTETYFTNPKAGLRDALVYWIKGGVYPKPNSNIKRDNLVRTGDLMPVVSKYSRVAPAGICRYRNTVLGENFKDNLFSAQFNPHRVLRHKLVREGASFRTEDKDFLWSDNENFHPTDVLEDADGSLLVVDTGGWFIKGCPLSQVSKPKFKGAIYRVHRKGADKIEDPYGSQIQWTSLSPEKAGEYLKDRRPFVRDRAQQLLVDQGTDAVWALTDLLHSSSRVDTRTKAVFALYRIGTDEALSSVRSALTDTDQQVQVAAARSLGLVRNERAVNNLIEVLQKGKPAAKRQAATALGQIGDSRAVSALLAAIDDTDDRFIKHAITYALISINKPQLVEKGLARNSTDIQETALIALDQMPGSSLRANQLIPFLTDRHKELQRTALWVASHHPEWSGDLISFLINRFEGPPLTEKERDLFEDMLISFCRNPSMQMFMAEQIQGATNKRKLFILNVMEKCNIKEIPQTWVEQLEKQLSSDDSHVQDKALELARLRGIPSLSGELQQIINDKQNLVTLRIKALGALTELQPKITDQHFDFLYGQLQAGDETPIRQRQSADILARAKLSESQLLRLATEYLPKADASMLPRLAPIFKGSHNKQIGKAVASTLINSPSLDSFTEEKIRTIFAGYPADVKPLIDQLITKLHDVRADRQEHLQTLKSQMPKGNMDHGRKLFFGKATCSTCHMLGSEGGNLAPDLTSIQKDRSAHDLLEAIVYPSASFVRGYEPYRIKTKENTYIGVIQQQTSDAIVLGTGPQTSVRIPQNEIVSSNISDVSLMPQGFSQRLTDQEIVDLVTFLLGQDQNPESDERILR